MVLRIVADSNPRASRIARQSFNEVAFHTPFSVHGKTPDSTYQIA